MADKDTLSEQERAVLDRIASDPYAGQQEIADSLSLARPTIATYIAQLTRKGYLLGRAYVLAGSNRIVCLGGATVDRKYHTMQPLQRGTSNPARSRRSFGGVARNVAETLSRLDVPSTLVSVVGDDENGRSLIRHLQTTGVDTTRLMTASGHTTAEYTALLGPDNDLAFGIADMDILETITIEDVQRAWPVLASASWVFADCNLPQPVLSWLIARRGGARFQLAIDAVSSLKVMRLQGSLRGIDLLFLNVQEAAALLDASPGAPPSVLANELRATGIGSVALSLGSDGLLLAQDESMVEMPGLSARVVDVTGAGDALIAGTLSQLIKGEPLVGACRIGMLAAVLTIESEDSVSLSMSAQLLQNNIHRLAPQTLAPQSLAPQKRQGRKAS